MDSSHQASHQFPTRQPSATSCMLLLLLLCKALGPINNTTLSPTLTLLLFAHPFYLPHAHTLTLTHTHTHTPAPCASRTLPLLLFGASTMVGAAVANRLARQA